MHFRLKTSRETEEIFARIYQRVYLQPFALAKLSIALALNAEYKVGENYQLTDNDGLDLNRQTITGENDTLFKALIELNEGKYLEDEIFFPDYMKMYIDYGAKLLEQELRYTRTPYKHLVSLEQGI